jgi:starch-binding outer membrane protein, SusD/RagB family
MKLITTLLLLALAITSCKKYLDKKPDKSLTVPSSVQDLQSLLDYSNKLNTGSTSYGEISADNYYVPDSATWQSLAYDQRIGYIWESDLFNTGESNDWSSSYTIVYYSNVVLDELNKESFTAGTQQQRDNIKGQALFFRACSFYNLLPLFAKPYSLDSSSHDWGIALRLTSDFNIPSKRATVKQSFEQLISDAKQAAALLDTTSLVKTRPCKTAAYALLARTYLYMSEYASALLYADSALALQPALLDYKTLNASAARPIPVFNAEVIFHSTYGTTNLLNVYAKVDTNLYRSYQQPDLRRTVFFSTAPDGTRAFKGSYDGSARLFNGLATDELYLIRAECYARAGNTAEAMNNLNTLMSKRWSGAFTPFMASDPNQALQLILAERRKELLFRNIRWSDLKRLNKEPQFEVTIKRKIGTKEYFLAPNDLRYQLPLPVAVIQQTGMPQNPR